MQVLTEEKYRQDGRRPRDLRDIKASMGVCSRADGSAYLEVGHTRVLVAVYGPHETRSSKSSLEGALINCQFSSAVFSTTERKVRPRGDRKSVEMGFDIKNTFQHCILSHLYPRSKIDIFVELLQGDGSSLACSINAVTLALLDAGVCLKGLMVASSIGSFNDETLADLSHNEESQCTSKLILATIPHSNQIAMLSKNGRLTTDRIEECMDAASEACYKVFERLVHIVRQQASSVDE